MICGMHWRWFGSVACVFVAGLLFGQATTFESPQFLVRMSDSWITRHPSAGPIAIQNCVVVSPNGHFYLELHRQEFFGTGTLNIYEGLLNEKEVRILQDILETEKIRHLPGFAAPRSLPGDWDWVEAFDAVISRGNGDQEAGYVSLKWNGPHNTDNQEAAWQDSKTILQPLVEWFRALKTYEEPPRKRVSNKKSTACGFSP
jgi:hypothetical protein